MKWIVLVPLKALPRAKSRLAATATDPTEHARLVTAIRQDTLAAIEAAALVSTVLPVVDEAGVVARESFVQTVPGLNGGLAEAAQYAAQRWPRHGVAALVGDLPALRPQDLDEALSAAATHPRAFVADWQGTGTTLLTARPGSALQPSYGSGSAARHGHDATALAAGASLRADVDTAADLQYAATLGVGAATAAVLASTDTHRSPAACMIDP